MRSSGKNGRLRTRLLRCAILYVTALQGQPQDMAQHGTSLLILFIQLPRLAFQDPNMRSTQSIEIYADLQPFDNRPILRWEIVA